MNETLNNKNKTFRQKLEERWEIKGWWQILVIFIVFGLTGSLSVRISKPILEFLNIHKETLNPFLFWPLRILIIFPIYQVLLITIGTILGQFKFFWKMEKKMLGRFIPALREKRTPKSI